MTLDLDLDKPLREIKQDLERIYFEHHLVRFKWRIPALAKFAGTGKSHAYRKLRKLGLTRRNAP